MATQGRRRSPAVLLGLLGEALLLAGLLVALPINNLVEYAYFDRPMSLLGMLDSPGPIVVLVVGILWYAVLWRWVDRRAWERVRSSRHLMVLMLWAGAAYLFLWWVISCADGLAHTSERTAMAAMAFGAPVVTFYLARSTARDWRRWREGESAGRAWVWGLVGFAGFPIALAAAGYLLVARPVRHLQTLDPRAAPETVRQACHRVIRWFPPAGHDAYIQLAFVGDETSVPRLIRAMRWAPDPDGGWECTWSHCYLALCAITNQAPGPSYRAWRIWYDAHKEKPRLEWIAEGFRAAGHDVAVGGGEDTVRTLLAIVHKHAHRQAGDEPWWFGRNAELLLESCDPETVRAVEKQLEEATRQ